MKLTTIKCRHKATNSHILHQMKLASSSQGLSNLNTLTNNSYLIGCNAVN